MSAVETIDSIRDADAALPPWRRRLERLWVGLVARCGLFYFERFAQGRIEGEAHLQTVLDRGCVLALNHVSYLDWIVVWAYFRYRVGRDITFIGKDSLFRGGWSGPLMRQTGVVRVSDDGDRFLDKAGYRRLRRAPVIGIFPEGTRSPDGRLQPAKSGVIKLALRLDRPILPVALDGFYDAWPRGALLPRWRPAPCRIAFGEPLVLEEADDAPKQLDRTTDLVMQRIAGLLAAA